MTDGANPTELGMLVIHLGIILGVIANIVILVRALRNGKDRR